MLGHLLFQRVHYALARGHSLLILAPFHLLFAFLFPLIDRLVGGL
jgi:hypothetical protein